MTSEVESVWWKWANILTQAFIGPLVVAIILLCVQAYGSTTDQMDKRLRRIETNVATITTTLNDKLIDVYPRAEANEANTAQNQRIGAVEHRVENVEIVLNRTRR